MKVLNVSVITSTNGLPIKSGTLKFLQDSFKETITELIINKIGPAGYSTSAIYVLWGCRSSISGGNTVISEGAIFFNGEVYHSPAKTVVTPVNPNIILANLSVTQYTTNADPVTMTLGGTVNVHDIRQVDYTTGSSGSGNIGNYPDFIYLDKIWVDLTLYNSGGVVAWTNADVNMYNAAFQDRGNSVQLCGKITSGAAAGTLPMFTLPVGSRPSKVSVLFAMVTTSISTTLRIITINTDGQCTVNCDSNTGGITVWLDGLVFRKF